MRFTVEANLFVECYETTVKILKIWTPEKLL